MIEHIIGIFAPLQCVECGKEGFVLCTSCKPPAPPLLRKCHFCKASGAAVCSGCRKTTGIGMLYAATEYTNTIKKVVHTAKYERSRAALRYMAKEIVRAHPELFKDGILCHVPTVNSRARQRGYDQAAYMAHEIMKYTSLPHISLLNRHTGTRQAGATRAQRLQNMEQAFYTRTRAVPPNTKIILIDDVITTGASMRAAASCIRAHTDAPIVAVSYALKP